ncbi:hypothetical protein [Bacillus sp. FJAT-29814]|uniref:hypothetical protein n=1 Tax=Bacillus sp. FJAT-29814 TaxID=1729688 RepID=UPI00083186F8|nr:hypothetical protein [Bacillus sp. FJAT-29814]
MRVVLQVVIGVLVGWLLFYLFGIEQPEVIKYLYKYLNSLLVFFIVVVAVPASCFAFFHRFKVFGIAVSLTMVGLFLVVYIALNSGGIGF